MEDSGIIKLYFNRDERALKETEYKYGKLCYSIAKNILNNKEDSEECVNDTYLVVWNKIPPTCPESFKAFICKIVRNLALKKSEYNHAKKRNINAAVSIEELQKILPDKMIEEKRQAEELGRIISEFLKKEKAEARVIFVRRYWFFDSISEIADKYSFSESKVKSILFHTRNRLKEYLIKEGIKL